MLLSVAAGLGQQVAPGDPEAYIAEHHIEETSIVQSWLNSGDARSRAWGSYLVGVDGLVSLVPELLKIVEAAPAGSLGHVRGRATDADAALITAVDALIRMNVVVPVDTSYRLYEKLPDAALILLARSPEREDALTKIFHQEKSALLWLAAANLLAQHPPAWLVRELLTAFVMRVRIAVIDPGQAIPDRNPGEGCAMDRFLIRDDHFKDWPKAKLYGLEKASDKSHSLSPGLQAVGYSEFLTSDFLPAWSGDCWTGLLSEYRHGLLAQMAQGTVATFALKQNVFAPIEYSDENAYLQQLRRTLAKQADVFRSVCVDYESLGLLSAKDVSELRLNVALQVTDERVSPTDSLPSLEQTVGLALGLSAPVNIYRQ